MEVRMERLKELRIRKGYSQQELADMSTVAQHTISTIEMGQRAPQGRTLRKLAAALGVDVEELTIPKADAPPPSEAAGPETTRGGPDFDAKTHGHRLAAQWRVALASIKGADTRADIYGALLWRLWVDANRARDSFENAAQGEYASTPEFRETLRDMDEAISEIKAPTREFYGGLMKQLAEGAAREFEDLAGLDTQAVWWARPRI
jgi:transcriptional regulator with XRE-family HTH domain